MVMPSTSSLANRAFTRSFRSGSRKVSSKSASNGVRPISSANCATRRPINSGDEAASMISKASQRGLST